MTKTYKDGLTGKVETSREYWLRTAKGSVIASAEVYEMIADECTRTDSLGQPTCTWHAAAVVTNTLDRCNCNPCVRARAARAR